MLFESLYSTSTFCWFLDWFDDRRQNQGHAVKRMSPRMSRRMASREESEFPVGHEGDAEFFTRRILYDDLAVVIRRFPAAHGAPTGGRPLVLVHGIGVSSRYFHPLAAQLAHHAPVFLVDLPGYGSAPDPHRDVSIVDHAGVLAKFLKADGIDAPVLVGHSMGTQVVTQLALDYPEMTNSLVLLAPTMDPEARTLWRAGARLLRDILTCEKPKVNAIVSIDYFFRCGVPYFLKQTKPLFSDRIEDRLPLLNVHALVLRGDRDCVSPGPWSRTVAALLRDGRYHEVKGPHVIMYTDPKKIAALIVDFVMA
jgi:pimeloyl-ACP methyl ester carboxylesterase